MHELEARTLLSKGVPGLSQPRIVELARRLGEWPFALELGRAMMRQRIEQGDSVDHSAERLMQILNKRGPHGLARGTGDLRSQTVDGILEGSLELLNYEQRRQLMELSVFPEDVAIPLSAAAALWGLDELETEETLQKFARLYLLKLDLGRGSVRLHDVMRQWLAAGVTNVSDLHNRLVDAWPDCMHLPDVYAWRWLPWHLAQTRRISDLQKLLFDPCWLQEKLAHTDVNAVISDFDRLKPAREAYLIQGAIRLSAHILAKDPRQFASQLVGRLIEHSQPVIRDFIAQLTNTAVGPWLRPLRPALDQPETGLLRTILGGLREWHSAQMGGERHPCLTIGP